MKLRVMDSTGDSEHDDTTPESAAKLREAFDKVMSKGGACFAVNRGEGKEDKQVRQFGELEADNLMVPCIVGG